MSKPPVSLAIDSGPSWQRRETRPSRVSSPNAAKIAAEPGMPAFALALRVLGKVLLDQLHLHRPAFFVLAECFRTARQGNLVETGLGHGQHDSSGGVVEREHDQRGRRLRGISFRLCARMPAERKQPL